MGSVATATTVIRGFGWLRQGAEWWTVGGFRLACGASGHSRCACEQPPERWGWSYRRDAGGSGPKREASETPEGCFELGRPGPGGVEAQDQAVPA